MRRQLHALALLTLRERTSKPNEQHVRWAPGPVWVLKRKHTPLAPRRESSSHSSVVQIVAYSTLSRQVVWLTVDKCVLSYVLAEVDDHYEDCPLRYDTLQPGR
jgi:hypothetical protein